MVVLIEEFRLDDLVFKYDKLYTTLRMLLYVHSTQICICFKNIPWYLLLGKRGFFLSIAQHAKVICKPFKRLWLSLIATSLKHHIWSNPNISCLDKQKYVLEKQKRRKKCKLCVIQNL